MEYYLPKKTQNVINKSQQCTNLRLLLDKYPPRDVVNKDEAQDNKKDTKGSWLRDIISCHKGNDGLAKAAYHRWYSYTSALQAVHFSGTIDWRMVVGLGGNSILETDITLQHLYGTPIIPSSALKGLARSYAAMEDKEVYIKKGDRSVPSEKLDSDHSDIQRIFGSQDKTGSVIFFDAVPKGGEAHFELDIMNPHYPEYYQGTKPPANNQNPVPIPFLTIARTPFMFALAPRQPGEKEQEKDLERALKWLRDALEQYGVGGKTSAGYGYFRKFISQPPLPEDAYTQPLPTKPIDPELKKAEGYKLELDALKDVAGQIHGYYQKWQKIESEKGRLLLAQAIVEKVRQAGREKATAEKAWYKELRAFLDATQS